MPATYTANLGLALPQVDVDTGWGTTLNTDFTTIDDIFASNGTGTSVGLNVNSGKTLVMGGTLVLGRNDGTNTATGPTAIRGAAKTGTNVTGADLTIKAANGTGSGGSGDIIIQTAAPGGTGSTACTFQNTLVLKANGNVGILTDSPDGILDVKGSNTADVDNWVYIRGGNTQSQEPTFSGSLTNGNGFAFGTNYSNDDEANMVWDQTVSSAQYMSISKSNGSVVTEQMRLNSSGALGFDGANYGTAGQVLTSAGSAAPPTWDDVVSLTAMTAVTLTNQTSVTFEDIPSGVRSVQVVFHNVQLSGTANIYIQLGTSSSWVSTGYVSLSTVSSLSSPTKNTEENGFLIVRGSSNTDNFGILNLSRITSNYWDCSYTLVDNNNSDICVGGGGVNLAGTLTKIRLLRTGTTATFNNGFVNIIYQR